MIFLVFLLLKLKINFLVDKHMKCTEPEKTEIIPEEKHKIEEEISFEMQTQLQNKEMDIESDVKPLSKENVKKIGRLIDLFLRILLFILRRRKIFSIRIKRRIRLKSSDGR